MQQKNLNDHLAPPRMLLRTPKGCEHPWLGTPDLGTHQTLPGSKFHATTGEFCLKFSQAHGIKTLKLAC